MSLTRLIKEVSNLRVRFEGTEDILAWDMTPYRDWLRRGDQSVYDMFKAHCRGQTVVLTALQRAMSATLNEHGDVILFVMGSLARLEHIIGVSDIDLLAMTEDGTHLVMQGEMLAARGPRSRVEFLMDRGSLVGDVVTHQSRFRRFDAALADGFHTNLRTALSRQRLKRHTFEVCGVPFHGDTFFYTRKELFGQLGKFDEPSWSVIHRASLVFESAYFPNSAQKFANEMRSDINQVYKISADIMDAQFPMLGALLIVFLTKSGSLAKIAKLGLEAMHGPKARESRLYPSEVLKTLVGRIWSSAVHMMLLHTLYWTSQLSSKDYSSDRLRFKLCRSPMHKLLVDIPALVKEMLEAIGLEPTRIPGPEDKRDEIVALMNHIFDFVGPPLGRKQAGNPLKNNGETQAHSETGIMPLASTYISFYLMSKRARERRKPITRAQYDDMVEKNFQLFEYLKDFERLTLLLVTNTDNQGDFRQIGFFRLFAAEVIDKHLCEGFMRKTHQGGPAKARQ